MARTTGSFLFVCHFLIVVLDQLSEQGVRQIADELNQLALRLALALHDLCDLDEQIIRFRRMHRLLPGLQPFIAYAVGLGDQEQHRIIRDYAACFIDSDCRSCFSN